MCDGAKRMGFLAGHRGLASELTFGWLVVDGLTWLQVKINKYFQGKIVKNLTHIF